MGTGAVYVVLAGVEKHPSWLTTIETVFYFLNMSLFLLNVSTLLLQAIRMFFSAALSHASDDQTMNTVSSVDSLSSTVYPYPRRSCQGHLRTSRRTFVCDDYHWYNKLCRSTGTRQSRIYLWVVLASRFFRSTQRSINMFVTIGSMYPSP